MREDGNNVDIDNEMVNQAKIALCTIISQKRQVKDSED